MHTNIGGAYFENLFCMWQGDGRYRRKHLLHLRVLCSTLDGRWRITRVSRGRLSIWWTLFRTGRDLVEVQYVRYDVDVGDQVCHFLSAGDSDLILG